MDSVHRPRHIGIIMDGNGRWATSRNLARTRGHQEGINAAKRVVVEAIRQGVEYLTLYAFSTENWRRARSEVGFIMSLLSGQLRKEYEFYRANRIRIRHIGNLDGLPRVVGREIRAVTEETSDFDAITVNLAVNYGGRDEIVRAVNRWIGSWDDGAGPRAVRAEDIETNLDSPLLPNPDLLIRTGGERRISNFLLWEGAYSELYFSDRLWPDWDADDLDAAIADFRTRKRNFGGDR